MSRRRSVIRGVALLCAIAIVGGATGWFVKRSLSQFDVNIQPANGANAVDPRVPVMVDAVGAGVRISSLDIRDSSGNRLATDGGTERQTLVDPLHFGERYQVAVVIERPWAGQRESRLLGFSTVSAPQLDGRHERTLNPDGSLNLDFDQTVGSLEASGSVAFDVQPDSSRRHFTLQAKDYPAGQTFPIEIRLTTSTGVPVPPLMLAITTAPPLSATITPNALSGLGLAMPIEVTFSEPLADRGTIGQHFTIQTENGEPVPGRWFWYNSKRLRFAPEPHWPARSTIQVEFNADGVKSAQGGMLLDVPRARFNTGTDRRIVVYLDKQQLVAMEDGSVVKTLRVSTGKAKTPTVTGSFYIYARFPLKTMRSRAKPGQPGHYVVENVPYAQYFHADYAFHGAWWHNGFGHPASHGCVNLSTRNHNRRWPAAPEDAGWLYRWASLGVPVTVSRAGPASTQVALKSE